MNWLNEKVIKNLFRITLLVILLLVTYWLYAKYKAESLAEYERQNVYTQPKNIDSAASSPDLRAIVQRQIDSIKKASSNLPALSQAHITPSAEQNDSTSIRTTTTQPKSAEETTGTKNENTNFILHAPSALFSHTYLVPIGKTVPVNILWAETANAAAIAYKLITIKADDIVDKKVKFTIEDPFNVLVFSQTGYAAGDKIIIEDERHHLNIFIVQVKANSVVIKIESRLNESIVSKLKKQSE